MKSNYNYQTGKITCKVGEKNGKPSKTIPNQALSIPELIKRYANGQSLGGSKIPIFDENPEQDLLGGRPFASFDLSEQHQIVKNAKAEYQETIDRLRNNKKPEKSVSASVSDLSGDKLSEG